MSEKVKVGNIEIDQKMLEKLIAERQRRIEKAKIYQKKHYEKVSVSLRKEKLIKLYEGFNATTDEEKVSVKKAYAILRLYEQLPENLKIFVKEKIIGN
jgi:hypothetical protein